MAVTSSRVGVEGGAEAGGATGTSARGVPAGARHPPRALSHVAHVRERAFGGRGVGVQIQHVCATSPLRPSSVVAK
ncbi:hypothetical protein [Salinispora fenicalii]|uniref:hypothetical protein n=1 Tax=Salinispora fenicalii TaxID=1137263 RepID=UPI0012BD130F|nr:hypothetical protein [Salinispora fenicalii]